MLNKFFKLFLLALLSAAPALSWRKSNDDCPAYGCPLLPEEFVDIQEKLRLLHDGVNDDEGVQELLNHSTKNEGGAVLTLMGYKGGKIEDQINQDRAVLIDPYLQKKSARFLGVFDGHAERGEVVSEFARKEMPRILGEKLERVKKWMVGSDISTWYPKDQVKAALTQTFLDVHRSIPTNGQGGATASVMLQLGSNVFFANVGDSRSFLVIAQPNKVAIVYKTREDKPHLPDERKRIEEAGGLVSIPRGDEDDSSRVVKIDPKKGTTFGLAMSRSIGDWDMGEVGVIASPLVDTVDLKEAMRAFQTEEECVPSEEDPDSCVVDLDQAEKIDTENTVVFAVSATDGITDYLDPEEIAKHIAPIMLKPDSSHLLVRCGGLIFAAADGWKKDMEGTYRDDITIAVSKLSWE